MKAARLEGLDLFRGLAVIAMILVNSPGSAQVWWPLDHAEWHGWTPTDLIFPAFLFAVGTALALSFPRRIDGAVWLRIARRTLALIALGWAIQILARPELATFRFMGVLQRIGLCYALAAGFAILTAWRDAEGRAHLRPALIAAAAVDALILYWILMTFVPVPRFGAGVLTPDGNLAGYVDRAVLGTAHIWRFGTGAAGTPVYDPEGLLSTLPALANLFFGMLAAIAWQRSPERALGWIAAGGAALVVAGLALDPWFPINKRIWTSSFALLTSGTAALLLVLCMLVARSGFARWLAPLRIAGMNAIFAYVLSLLLVILAIRVKVAPGVSLQAWAIGQINAVVPDPYLASFLFAVTILLLVFAALVPLDRRGLYLRL